MLHLLRRGGSLAIFANHLSWISGCEAIREYLVEQAESGKEIRIFVPRENNVTNELAAAGAQIVTYESLDYEPEARFTLLNPQEPGSSLLAIGRGVFPKFYVEEFSDQTHARVISVVRDLLQVVERVNSGAKP
jgi:hypothetical protein